MTGGVVALSGGVGGAKLAQGLYRVVDPDALTVIVNTGDDFEHLGLKISPDIDSVIYALADLDDLERGWGRRAETWSFMAALTALGAPAWFRLGDGDLAMHVERTRLQADGRTLGEVTAHIARALGIRAHVVPMSDAPVPTMVDTDQGVLGFQEYFVNRRCEPRIRSFSFHGAQSAVPPQAALAAIGDPSLRAIVICPSNPFVSIDPILAIPGFRAALAAAPAPVVAVTPIVGGRAIKGPAAKMLLELGLPVSGLEVARHYAGLIDAFVLDQADASLTGGSCDSRDVGVPVFHADTMMHCAEDRRRLAAQVLAIADRLARGGRRIA